MARTVESSREQRERDAVKWRLVVGVMGGGGEHTIMGQRAFLLFFSSLGIGLFTERGMDDYLI